MKNWFKSGDPWIWLTASSVSLSLIVVFSLIAVIMVRGLGYFWAATVIEARYEEPNAPPITILGEIYDNEKVLTKRLSKNLQPLANGQESITRSLIKTGNRDLYGLDFKWVLDPVLKDIRYPEKVLVVERREWGNFYGYLQTLKKDKQVIATGEEAWKQLPQYIEQTHQLFKQINRIEKGEMGAINYQLEKLRLKERKLQLQNDTDPQKRATIEEQRQTYHQQSEEYKKHLTDLYQQINRESIVVKEMGGKEVEIPLAKVVSVYRPNSLSFMEKVAFYFAKVWEFMTDDPREANTEGGIFPAIYGTVIMVLMMSLIVTPFGVITAVYLHEYAKQGFLTRTIRIAVNNLAGVPAIVYGVFGLGFFVYFLGGNIDRLFFPEAAPAPMFGTPGLLWASLTLALLTVPVVIVATEEGLSRIPSAIREGSLALGATKAETLWRTILPMASPAMMTGLILAIARAAGEVAPLMLVGVVKLAPSLPLDMNAPFLHLERKFMHLGFHINDLGFQSPNVEAARPLVYATAFLLVLVIIILNLTAIWIRNRLREKYKSLETV
ncbi:MAG: phosphate transporter permease PstA [Pseudomonadota bacterium]|jgi:phosphate transport system permease protein